MADIHPIRNETDYERALQEIATLVEQDLRPETSDGEQLELLSLVIQDYEARHYPIPAPDDPVEVILFYMEKNGLSRKDLIPYLGDKARVSDVLNRRRSLSLTMIRRLSQGLSIPADLLIGLPRRPASRQVGNVRIYPTP